MAALNTIERIDNVIKQLKKDKPQFDCYKGRDMYGLGKILEKNIPELIENRKEDGRDFKYVGGKGYEYILRNFEEDCGGNVNFANEFRVETLFLGNGKTSLASYGVPESPFKGDKATKTKTDIRVDSVSEKTINEGMRCYAKHASRKTGLFLHLGYEGGNK